MYKKQNKYILFIIILIIILCMISFIIIGFYQSNKSANISNISIYRIENCVSKNITARQILHKDNSIFVGYSKKEIENGYYDLKIILEDENIKVYINKLWKEFNELLYEKDYIHQVVNSILGIFEINEETHRELLIEYITNGYLASKGVNKEFSSNEKKYIDKITIKSEIVDSELILNICKEVDNEN